MRKRTTILATVASVFTIIFSTSSTAFAAHPAHTTYCYPSQSTIHRVKLVTTFDDGGSSTNIRVYSARVYFEKKVSGVWELYNWGSSMRLNQLRNGVSNDQYGPVDPSSTDLWYPQNNFYNRSTNDIGVNYTMSGYPGGLYVSCSKYVGDSVL